MSKPQVLQLRGDALTADPRLDRVASFDPSSRRYPARALLADTTGTERPPLRSWTWPNRIVTDQTRQGGACVGHGHGGRILNPPVSGGPAGSFEVPDDFCGGIYRAAQQIDEWAGSDYEGTSVLAGAKHCLSAGLYTSYHWAFTIDDALLSLAHLGPVVTGLPWLDSMFEPRPSGLLDCTGAFAGGHCIRARGLRLRAQLPGERRGPIEVVRLVQSWGNNWGVNGECFIRLDDLAALLLDEGECCVPVEPGQHTSL